MKLSMKTWVFATYGPNVPPDQAVRNMNREIAVGDEILISRSIFFDPRTLDNRFFAVVNQMPGDTIVSGVNPEFGYAFPHQVSGFALVSFASNLCFATCIMVCLKAEAAMASFIRGVSTQYHKARRLLGDSGIIHPLVLGSSCIVRWIDRSRRAFTPAWLQEAVSFLYKNESLRLPYIAVEDAPDTAVAIQCEKCGSTCATVMYVVKRNAFAELCGGCAEMEPDSVKAKFSGIPIISPAMAKFGGLV